MFGLPNKRKNSIVWPRDIVDDPASLVVEAIKTANRPCRPDLVEVFWNGWGDQDDPDDPDDQNRETVSLNKKRVSKGVCIRHFLNRLKIQVFIIFIKQENDTAYPYSDPNSKIPITSKASRDSSIGNAKTEQ